MHIFPGCGFCGSRVQSSGAAGSLVLRRLLALLSPAQEHLGLCVSGHLGRHGPWFLRCLPRAPFCWQLRFCSAQRCERVYLTPPPAPRGREVAFGGAGGSHPFSFHLLIRKK